VSRETSGPLAERKKHRYMTNACATLPTSGTRKYSISFDEILALPHRLLVRHLKY
jgi:hypothetical protein